MGLAEPGGTTAEQGSARARRGHGARDTRSAGRPDGDHLRRPRLLQPLPQTLYGRLGPTPALRSAKRRRTPLSNRACSSPSSRQRARAPSCLDLGAVSPLPAFPRNRLDAPAMPELRPPRDRFRRMPLPGIPADWRRCPNRPGLSPLPRPRACRRGGASRQFRHAADRRVTYLPGASRPSQRAEKAS
jgi:hypothetical protein